MPSTKATLASWCASTTPHGRTGTVSKTLPTCRAWHSARRSPPTSPPSNTARSHRQAPLRLLTSRWSEARTERQAFKRIRSAPCFGPRGQHAQGSAALVFCGWRPRRQRLYRLKVRVRWPILESLLADIVSAQPSHRPSRVA